MAVSCIVMGCVLGKQPISPKQSEYSSVKSVTEELTCNTRLMRFKFSLVLSPRIGEEQVLATMNNLQVPIYS